MSPLSVYDYIIFIGMLGFSTSIGIYFGCFGTKQSTTKEYLMGGKNMKVLPIAVSVAVSHISGGMLLGSVSDVYRYGSGVWLFLVSYVIMGFLAVFVYFPVFFKLKTTNIYDYLEKRFDTKIRKLAFFIYLLYEVLKFPVHAYTPSLTFATATGFDVNIIGAILCLICVFYTSIGGFRTVVWTDFLQCGVIVVCLLTVCGIGIDASGGMATVWKSAVDGERLQIFNFSLDPTARDTFWNFFLGTTLIFTGIIMVHQTGIQKFLALATFEDCKRSVVYSIISMSLIQTANVAIGLAVYSTYKDCDPLTTKKISKHDQLFPYFVTNVCSSFPGVSGLFLATIASASLSTMSSNLNALSGVIYKDVVCPFLKTSPSEKRGSKILKIIVLVVGVLCTCLVYLVDKLGEILSVTFTVAGITQGPLLGIFTLGILFPKANQKGGLYGMVVGFISVATIALPAKYYQLRGVSKDPTKPLSTNCGSVNQTLSDIHALPSNAISNQFSQVPWIFRISFYYYVLIGTATTVIVGLVVSSMTKRHTSVDKNLLSPIVHSCLSKKSQNGERVTYVGVQKAVEILETND